MASNVEQREIKQYLFDMRKSLNENTSCLVRIEERLRNFIEKVQEQEIELDDVKKHVQTVRTVSKIFTICIAVVSAFAALWGAVGRH